MTEWRYLKDGRCLHAVHNPDSRFAVAECGRAPAWLDLTSWWFGTGCQEEYERAAALPRCKQCVQAVAR